MSSGSNLPVEKEEDKEEIASKNIGNSSEIASGKETSAEEKTEKGNFDGADEKELPEEIKNEEETDKATVSSREKQIEEDDDGFKTPTSADHRIPAITECPPAPRKPRPPKRKASPPGARRNLQFDTSPEVESIFRPIPDEDVPEDSKMKKARRDDDEESS